MDLEEDKKITVLLKQTGKTVSNPIEKSWNFRFYSCKPKHSDGIYCIFNVNLNIFNEKKKSELNSLESVYK